MSETLCSNLCDALFFIFSNFKSLHFFLIIQIFARSLPEGISAELFHLDLQIAELNPAFCKRLHTSFIIQFRQPLSTIFRQEQPFSDCFAPFTVSLAMLRIFDSNDVVRHNTACSKNEFKLIKGEKLENKKHIEEFGQRAKN